MFCNLHTLCYGCVRLCVIHENPILRGGLPNKRGAWTIFRFKGGLVKNKWDGVFEGG